MTLATAVRPFRIGDAHETMIDRSPADDTVREMAELLRDERPSMLVSGITVAAVTVGVAVEAIAVPFKLNADLGTLIFLGLFAALALSVVRTATLMIAAGRPLMDQLGELRRQTGAPVDPTVPWTPIRSLPETSRADVRECAKAVIAAAHFRNARMRLALTWATVAIICFCAWTLALLILAGRI